MSSSKSIGIIDIGSNSIRLVIYEINAHGAYRVVSEHKDSARLSERIGSDGILYSKDIISIVPILSHYALLCKVHEVQTIRAVATAAIRNAANSAEIVRILQEQTGLRIEVLSGTEEARYGYLGVINTIDIRDGLIIDIGGGSTEVTLLRNRKLLHSVSFPFGAVNTTRQFMKNGNLTEQEMGDIRRMVEDAILAHPWIAGSPNLPMIGLGGTIRTLGKISQKRSKYSLQLAHNYTLKPGELRDFLLLLFSMPLEKRKKIDGLSKERADIMVPGLIIMDTIFEAAGSSACIISGSGLRDGLFYETFDPKHPIKEDVLEASIHNLLLLHPNAAVKHVSHVDKFAMQLYHTLTAPPESEDRSQRYLHTAALLHRIGASVHYYHYLKHTEYMMTGAHIDGLSHREIVICSFIASYKTKSRTHQQVLAYKDLLMESDAALIIKLGTLLKLAIALDHSETQPVQELQTTQTESTLTLKLLCIHNPIMELKELAAISKDFEKIWGLKLKTQAGVFSMK
ncbi:exopolyphosphatase/guanosine-5'-triphosphate,3'-diphosphate pyrophosphatase [Paenibacillus sp. V4I3]|uniref:Ppx/GppA phosphatase family protein n=1 Tax=unclassified Paenibacillus TaxID=185978 RepID=UPI00277DC2E0|nr:MULTISPECIES: Ppx/GppA phosphatase family protein [unclassified Paenibacillus]MDQ0873845.1 exopolyphosphatase/guanosine-5'-triphosphate,3'-diphosphate pyrophosphatase [Paenibacillus sp. V4I3]MDQ0890290.1 exopolyphosphatase/guanosine-5'-triphosphate,3'-diphosphate pyrophosphatase [Paenibacillus sp. V4I9]